MNIVNTIYIATLLIILWGCKVQQISIDANNKDIYLFDDERNNLDILHLPSRKVKNITIVRIGQPSDFVPIIKSSFFFVNEKDTMQVHCFCGQGSNYYFKNISFNQGSFYVNSKKSIEEKRGSQIITNKLVRNVLFENAIVRDYSQHSSIKKNMRLEDLTFKIIDFSDTAFVKLEPIKKEEFWDNNFLPKQSNE